MPSHRRAATASSCGYAGPSRKAAIKSAMSRPGPGSGIARDPAIQADAWVEDKTPKPNSAGFVDVIAGIELRRQFAHPRQPPARDMGQIVMLQMIAEIDADPVD